MVLATVHFQATDPDGLFAALETTGPLFDGVDGFGGFQVRRGIEDPHHILITAEWDSVADHEAWQQARGTEFVGALSAHIEGPPVIEHFA